MRYFDTEEEARLETSKLIQGLGNEAKWKVNVWQSGRAFHGSIDNALVEIFEAQGKVMAQVLPHYEREGVQESEGYKLDFSPATGVGKTSKEALQNWWNQTEEFVRLITDELNCTARFLDEVR